jgi:hypothetical protein
MLQCSNQCVAMRAEFEQKTKTKKMASIQTCTREEGGKTRPATRLLILTDIAEEVDDEVALLFTNTESPLHIEDIQVKFIGPRVAQAAARYTRLFGPHGLDRLRIVDAFDQRTGDQVPTTLLQIGPVDEAEAERVLDSQGGRLHSYVLLGDVGTTFNSRDPTAARIFMVAATHSWVVRTKQDGHVRVPLFTPDIAKSIGGELGSEVMRVGFRNTLGRAPALPFTQHLVGPAGANYEAVRSAYNIMAPGRNLADLPAHPAAVIAANRYMDGLDGKHPFAAAQLEILHQTVDDQRRGLARMLTALHAICGSPIDQVLFSNDLAVLDADTTQMCHAWDQTISGSTATLTPAYDVVGAFLAVCLASGTDWTCYFDQVAPGVVVLRSELCTSAFLADLLSG